VWQFDGSNWACASVKSSAAPLYLSIPAIGCIPQGTAVPGDGNDCGGGGTLRTDGDQSFPCEVRGRAGIRDTYVCPLALQTGAVIDAVTAYGSDFSATGYLEAAIWRVADGSFAPNYISGYGGTWQTSGVAFAGGYTSFPVFLLGQPAHTVAMGYRYMIGFAVRETNVTFDSFRVQYHIP
jgi:hypothetical protein